MTMLTNVTTSPPDFLPGSFYLVEFADLRRPQVVFAITPMSVDEAIEAAREIIQREYGEAPVRGERIRVSGPYPVGGEMSKRSVFP